MYCTHAGPIGCIMLVQWLHKYKVGHIDLILMKHHISQILLKFLNFPMCQTNLKVSKICWSFKPSALPIWVTLYENPLRVSLPSHLIFLHLAICSFLELPIGLNCCLSLQQWHVVYHLYLG